MEARLVETVILGHAVGDALGVPVEFFSREKLAQHPVKDMLGFGTLPVPQGSWSNVTSLPLACMDAMSGVGYVDYHAIMEKFDAYLSHGKYTPDGEFFDIGHHTRHAILKFREGTPPQLCGNASSTSNGCGALVRMDPVILYLYARHGNDLEASDMQIIHDMASITNAHPISHIACGLYVLLGVELCHGTSFMEALKSALATTRDFYRFLPNYTDCLSTVLEHLNEPEQLMQMSSEKIESDGYVVHVLEAVIWTLLHTKNFATAVMTAVNLGNNTNTIGAVTGSLAALLYGHRSIPERWWTALRGREQLERICQDFELHF